MTSTCSACSFFPAISSSCVSAASASTSCSLLGGFLSVSAFLQCEPDRAPKAVFRAHLISKSSCGSRRCRTSARLPDYEYVLHCSLPAVLPRHVPLPTGWSSCLLLCARPPRGSLLWRSTVLSDISCGCSSGARRLQVLSSGCLVLARSCLSAAAMLVAWNCIWVLPSVVVYLRLALLPAPLLVCSVTLVYLSTQYISSSCISRLLLWFNQSPFCLSNMFYGLLRPDTVVIHSHPYLLPASTERWAVTTSA